MKITQIALAALATATLSTAAAKAAPMSFTIVDGATTDSFTLDSNPTPAGIFDDTTTTPPSVDNPYFMNVSGVVAAGAQVNIKYLTFFGTDDEGGLLASQQPASDASAPAYFQFTGAQIFSGSASAPVFKAGVYDLLDPTTSQNATLTIAAVSAAPEPSAWALLLAGVAMVGAALRFGRRRSGLAAA